MTIQLPVIRTGFIPAPAMNKRDALGWPTGIRCPRCCAREIVYNGNYFCSGFSTADPVCKWALPEGEDGSRPAPHYELLEPALIQSQLDRIEG